MRDREIDSTEDERASHSASSAHSDWDSPRKVLEDLRRIELMSRRLVTDLMAGGYHSVFRGTGIEFEEVREYVPGDDPRAIDWKVTARLGRPFIKKFVDERESTALILFDLSPTLQSGFSYWSAREFATRISACLVGAAVKSRDRIGLLAFSDCDQHFIPPGRGPEQLLRILRELMSRPLGRGPSGLDDALITLRRLFPRRIVVFLVSDFLAAPAIDHQMGESRRLRETLARTGYENDAIAIRVLAPELAAPAGAGGRVVLRGHGQARPREYGRADLVAASARVQAFQSEQAEAIRGAGFDLIDFPIPLDASAEAIARPLLAYFRRREEKGVLRRGGRQ